MLYMCIYLYIYIYRERERARESSLHMRPVDWPCDAGGEGRGGARCPSQLPRSSRAHFRSDDHSDSLRLRSSLETKRDQTARLKSRCYYLRTFLNCCWNEICDFRLWLVKWIPNVAISFVVGEMIVKPVREQFEGPGAHPSSRAQVALTSSATSNIHTRNLLGWLETLCSITLT